LTLPRTRSHFSLFALQTTSNADMSDDDEVVSFEEGYAHLVDHRTVDTLDPSFSGGAFAQAEALPDVLATVYRPSGAAANAGGTLAIAMLLMSRTLVFSLAWEAPSVAWSKLQSSAALSPVQLTLNIERLRSPPSHLPAVASSPDDQRYQAQRSHQQEQQHRKPSDFSMPATDEYAQAGDRFFDLPAKPLPPVSAAKHAHADHSVRSGGHLRVSDSPPSSSICCCGPCIGPSTLDRLPLLSDRTLSSEELADASAQVSCCTLVGCACVHSYLCVCVGV
jgi:hypothetical protein